MIENTGAFAPLAKFFGGPETPGQEAGAIRAHQLASIQQMMPIMMAANAFNVCVVAIFFRDAPRHNSLFLWGLLVGGLGLVQLARVWKAKRTTPAERSVASIRRAIKASGLFGIAWGVLPFLVFDGIEGSRQFLLAAVLAGMMSGGGFGLAAVPGAGYAYAGAICGMTLLALISTGDQAFIFAGFLLVAFAAVIATIIWSHSRLFIGHLLDQTKMKRQAEVIGLLLKDFEESSSDWLWETNAQGQLGRVSERLAATLGYLPEALVGRQALELLEKLHENALNRSKAPLSLLRRSLARRHSFRDAVVAVRINGEDRLWSLTAKAIFSARGQFLGFRGVGSDVTAAKEAEEQIVFMARHDSVTGLPNRVLFKDRLEMALQRRQDEGAKFAVHFIDLDNFKSVNDTLGHPIGDKLLQEVAERLQSLTRVGDTIARFGGDEFALIQSHAADQDAASALAQRIVDMVAPAFEIDGRKIIIGASVGVALAPDDGKDSEELLKNADLALYSAKEGGRNGFRFFEKKMDEQAKARRKWELDLRLAIEREEFELYFQPFVSVASRQVTGFEALMRWRHPERGLVMPRDFIPIAEETGLIVQLGDWAIRKACQYAVNWPEPIRIAVNVSPLQFKSDDLCRSVFSALAASRLRPGRLELEITETLFLEKTDIVLSRLKELRQMGVRIALDDFGVGYSSLSHLRNFPVDKVKVDKSFVDELTTSPDAAAMVQAIADLSSALGMSTTAEGVEHFDQVEALTHQGFTEMQGYYFSTPQPICAVDALIASIGSAKRTAA